MGIFAKQPPSSTRPNGSREELADIYEARVRRLMTAHKAIDPNKPTMRADAAKRRLAIRNEIDRYLDAWLIAKAMSHR